MTNRTDIRPFRIDVPQAAIDDLHARLDNVRWPDDLPGAGWDYGVAVDEVRRLAGLWRSGYDWRAVEARLNEIPQFITEIDGQDVHFLHVRSPRADATPLILTHGWPGSFMEYVEVIAGLTEPDADAPAFHVVIPSLPGFAFSGPTTERGWNRYRTARAWAELMRRLGYERYGAVGNDAGSFVAPEVGRVDGEHVVGVHVTQIFSFPSGDPAEFENLSAEDQAALQHLQWFHENMSAFGQLQAQQPQTLSFALSDSPVGQLAWNLQLLRGLDDEFVLTNVMLYWVTGTAGSSARFYYEDAHAEHPTEPTTVPLALGMGPGDFISIRRFAERDHKNIVRWSAYERGGHYTAHEAPDILVDDLQAFFGSL